MDRNPSGDFGPVDGTGELARAGREEAKLRRQRDELAVQANSARRQIFQMQASIDLGGLIGIDLGDAADELDAADKALRHVERILRGYGARK